MGLVSVVFVAFALAMDAFAVAVIAGLSPGALTARRVFRLAFHFGLFQAMMPVIGWFAGTALHRAIADIDHWIAFSLLALVGSRMVIGALREVAYEERADPTTGWHLVVLSVATSIDALAVGLSLAVLGNPIAVPALVIGIVTAALTTAGMVLGRRIGLRWGPRIEAIGGGVLIVIGARILAHHLL
jgi:manganese efflux pump family protein